MAVRAGVSPAQVQRIWAVRGLEPHLVDSFKLSNDPAFEENLIDVVGLYLNPPEQAIMLGMDEKCSIQALDRTHPSLPMMKGRGATMTHDYNRNATTTLCSWSEIDFASISSRTGALLTASVVGIGGTIVAEVQWVQLIIGVQWSLLPEKTNA